MEVKVKCLRCNSINDLDKSNYEYQRKVLIDNMFYYVTFFRCSKCNEIRCVQVDDDYTKRLLKKEKEILHKVIELRKKDKKINDKITGDYQKVKTDLDDTRRDLKIKLNGKRANIFGTEEFFEMRFVNI